MYVLNKTVMRWKSRFRESLFHNFLKKNTPDLANFFRLRRSLGPPPKSIESYAHFTRPQMRTLMWMEDLVSVLEIC